MSLRFLFLIFISISLGLSACSDFKDVFNPGKSSHHVAAGSSSKKVKKTEASKEPEDNSGVRAPVKTKKGVYYFVKPGDTLRKIAEEYDFPREGLVKVNNIKRDKLIIGRRVFIPHKRIAEDYVDLKEIFAKIHKSRTRSKQKLNFVWPLKKYTLTSPFGWRNGRPHDAVDLSAPRGTPIFAAESGRVIFSKYFSGYGNLIVIKHGGNYHTVYAHNDRNYVRVGDDVKQGQKIAVVGRTGRATGPHLHFEVRQGPKAIDPTKVLPKK